MFLIRYPRFAIRSSTAAQFRELVSGRRRGPLAAVGRAALALAEVPYSAAVRLRNRRYDNPGRTEQVGAAVVSVGNLTLGGTGKTPFVEWLARWFTSRGVRVALVSRGYGAKMGRANDEALELAQSLPGIPHLQNPDRVRAAQQAIRDFGAQLVLLDDGFQHRRLARDLDIVLVDALEPLGFGHVFPRGTLREPLSGWGRAQAIALSRADLVAPAERERIRQEVARYAPQAVWLELCTQPRGLHNSSGVEQNFSALAGQCVAAFCGIGNPAGFRHQLLKCGYTLVALRELADHQPYPPALIENLAQWAAHSKCAAVVCTRKDLVKIPFDRLGEAPLWALSIGIEVTSGLAALDRLLESVATRAKARVDSC